MARIKKIIAEYNGFHTDYIFTTYYPNGLIDEVRRVKKFKSLNALNTVGYKEVIFYLEGKSTLEFAIQEIKKNTRRYAKRQLTWLRSKKNIHWVKTGVSVDELINQLNLK